MPELLGLSLFNDANLQAYYTLEDVNDDKNSNNLTNNGTVTFTAAKFSNGANLGASNTTKSLELASDFNINGGAASMVGWVKLNTEIGASFYEIFHLADAGSDTQLYLRYDYNSGTRRLIFGRNKFGSTDQTFTSTITLGTSNWYHLALTYDASTVKGYINGAFINSVAASGNGTVGIVDRFKIGAGDDGSGGEIYHASALFDDVAVFNRALTPTEIDLIANGATTTGGSFLFNFI